jgi:hypothetical protein
MSAMAGTARYGWLKQWVRQAAAQGTGRSRSHVRAKDVGQCSPANRIGTPADSSGNP